MKNTIRKVTILVLVLVFTLLTNNYALVETVSINKTIVSITGKVPSPCHIAATSVVMSGKTIKIFATSKNIRPEMKCIQELKPFSLSVPLNIKKNVAYKVYVNGIYRGTVRKK